MNVICLGCRTELTLSLVQEIKRYGFSKMSFGVQKITHTDSPDKNSSFRELAATQNRGPAYQSNEEENTNAPHRGERYALLV